MFGLEAFAAKWLAKTWFKPVMYLLAALAVVGYIYYEVDKFETAAYDRGYSAAKIDFANAALIRLNELGQKADDLSKQTSQLADALTTNQDSFGRLVASKTTGKTAQQAEGMVKVIDGKCRPTEEARETWNELQQLLED